MMSTKYLKGHLLINIGVIPTGYDDSFVGESTKVHLRQTSS